MYFYPGHQLISPLTWKDDRKNGHKKYILYSVKFENTFKNGQLIDSKEHSQNISPPEGQVTSENDEDYVPSDELLFELTQVVYGETLGQKYR